MLVVVRPKYLEHFSRTAKDDKGEIMFQYTVMRKAKPALEVGPNNNEDLWLAWDVEADNPTEAVEHVADIPGNYLIFDTTPIYVDVQPETKLKVQRNEHN
jgi:hypothetical protein